MKLALRIRIATPLTSLNRNGLRVSSICAGIIAYDAVVVIDLNLAS